MKKTKHVTIRQIRSAMLKAEQSGRAKEKAEVYRLVAQWLLHKAYKAIAREEHIFQKELLSAEELAELLDNAAFRRRVIGRAYADADCPYDWGLLIGGTIFEKQCRGKPALIFNLSPNNICRAGPAPGLHGVRWKGKTALVLIMRDFRPPGKKDKKGNTRRRHGNKKAK